MNGRSEREPVFSPADIRRERLAQWSIEMDKANATPVLCLAIGHNANEGEVHLCTPVNFSDDDLLAFLSIALIEIRKRKAAA